MKSGWEEGPQLKAACICICPNKKCISICKKNVTEGRTRGLQEYDNAYIIYAFYICPKKWCLQYASMTAGSRPLSSIVTNTFIYCFLVFIFFDHGPDTEMHVINNKNL